MLKFSSFIVIDIKKLFMLNVNKNHATEIKINNLNGLNLYRRRQT